MNASPSCASVDWRGGMGDEAGPDQADAPDGQDGDDRRGGRAEDQEKAVTAEHPEARR
jgi:hypothetical protein